MLVDVVWSSRARSDLIRIGAGLARLNPRAADELVLRLLDRAAMLADHPRAGVRRSDLRAGVRQLVWTPYLILYRTIPDADDRPVRRVEIVGVVDGRRALERLV